MINLPLFQAAAAQTSIDAAKSLDVTAREKMVLQAIKSFPAGCISDDVRIYCAEKFNIHSYSSVTARYKSLAEKGLIRFTGETRKGASGKSQRVMVA